MFDGSLMRHLLRTALILAATGCAARTPVLRFGEVAFPRPERETCAPGSVAGYKLTVVLRDEQGGAFPNEFVYLVPMEGPRTEPQIVRTDQLGVAVVTAAGSRSYSVFVVAAGFEPQARALTLEPGCSGSIAFALRVGPMIGLK